MKVLISAYACEPDRGSEPEVGFGAALAAASDHEVWVLTRENNVAPVRRGLADHPKRDRIHVHGVDLGARALRLKKTLGRASLHWYYNRWQAAAAAKGRDLDRRMGFDLVHHITFATYWQPAGMAEIGKPFVWGPVGGAVTVPPSLMSQLGPRGRLEEVARARALPTLGRLPGVRATQRAATIALAQEAVTAARLTDSPEVRILSNAIAASVHSELGDGPRRSDVSFVGRLIPWKGAELAIRTMSYVAHDEAALRLYGNGPERGRLERLAMDLGLSDRVVFEGRVPRADLHRRLAASGVVLHTSLRGSGLSVAESLALGAPVVCLDQGEAGAILDRWPQVPNAAIAPASPEETARRLAAAVDGFLADPPPRVATPVPPSPTFEQALLEAYRDAVSGRPVQ